MSIALSLLPWMSQPPTHRGAGRPPGDLYRNTRLRHIRCAYLHYVEKMTFKKLAARFRVSVATAHRWVKVALTYPDAEAEGLRRQVDNRPK